MLTYDMTARGRQPLYQYLYQCIKNDILSGAIGPDEKLPSKRSLAKHLDISVITVENAYHLLEIEGYIYTKEKIGYFAERLKRRPSSIPSRPEYVKEPQEHEYFADFSSNKVEYSLFPLSVMTKLCREMLSLQNPDFLKTVPYNGTAILRYAIANYLADYRGMEVDPDQIIIGCGTEYLYSRLLECFPEGTVLGLEDPGNHKFASIAQRYRIPVEFLPIDRYGVSMPELDSSPVSLLHISPANVFPMGYIMPIKRRLDVLSWLYQDEKRYLIEDDFDSEFNSYGASDSPVFSRDYNERTIYMNTFSKTMIPSIRAAYMILPHSLLHRYRETTSFYSCTVSSTDQFVFANFISRGYFERHLMHTGNVFRSKRAALLRELDADFISSMAEIRTPLAGTSIYLENLRSGLTPEQIKKNAKQLDIRLAFVSDYMEHPARSDERTMILNYASVPHERFGEALKRLRQAMTAG